MTISFQCKICEKPVLKKCENCKLWVHIKCNKIKKQIYNLLMEDDTAWYCIKCIKSIFPFNDIDNNKLHSTIQGKKIKFTIFSKKTNSNEHTLTERLNDMMNQKKFDNPSSYYDYEKFNENFD